MKAQQFIFCKPQAKIVISSTTPCRQLDFRNWIHLFYIDDFWSIHEKLEINCCLVDCFCILPLRIWATSPAKRPFVLSTKAPQGCCRRIMTACYGGVFGTQTLARGTAQNPLPGHPIYIFEASHIRKNGENATCLLGANVAIAWSQRYLIPRYFKIKP